MLLGNFRLPFLALVGYVQRGLVFVLLLLLMGLTLSRECVCVCLFNGRRPVPITQVLNIPYWDKSRQVVRPGLQCLYT